MENAHSIGEPRSNVGRVCDEHAPKPDPRFFALPLAWFLGKFVKLGFPVGPNNALEHMWVEATALGESAYELKGLLRNDSIFEIALIEGVDIDFNRNEVEAMIDANGRYL